MQAIILAAGKGSRIRSVSDKPKSLLLINDKEIINHQIDALKKYSIDNILIVTGFNAHLVREATKKNNVNYVHNPFFESCNVLGSFWFTLSKLEDSFFFMHADTIFDQEVISKLMNGDGDLRLAVEFKKTNEEEMKVNLENGYVKQISKTIPLEKSHGEFTGVALINKSLIDEIISNTKSVIEDEGSLNSFFEVVIQRLIDKGLKVNAIDIQECRSIEIDFPEDYEKAKSAFKENNV